MTEPAIPDRPPDSWRLADPGEHPAPDGQISIVERWNLTPEETRGLPGDQPSPFVPVVPYVDEQGQPMGVGRAVEGPGLQARRAAMIQRIRESSLFAPAPTDYLENLLRIGESERRQLIQGDWPAEDPREAQSGRAMEHRRRARPSWFEEQGFYGRPSAPRHEYTERLERENAALRAEVATMREAMGWSTDNAPALGGGKEDGR